MQQGSLIKSGRKRGPDVWQFRWAERGPHGKRIYRKRVIGTVWQYPDADSARKAVSGLMREVNAQSLQRSFHQMTVSEACDHFIQRELTKDNTWRSYSTKRAYKAGSHRAATSERDVLPRRLVRLARHSLAGRNNAISVRLVRNMGL
jgi:hypothetical protein